MSSSRPSDKVAFNFYTIFCLISYISAFSALSVCQLGISSTDLVGPVGSIGVAVIVGTVRLVGPVRLIGLVGLIVPVTIHQSVEASDVTEKGN